MKFGKFEIELINTGNFALDGGAMFGVIPKAIWSKSYNSGDDLNRIPLAARILLFRTLDRNILVDTGNGNKLHPKLIERYGLDTVNSDFDQVLSGFNLKSDDITDVILTHLHFDHSGGATKIENNEVIPTFKNAKYYVQKAQYEWAINPTEKDRASFFNENYVPLLENGVLELLDGDGELFDNIELITTDGHTKSMQMVKLKNGSESMVYCADFAATSAHIPVPFVMGYDNEPLVAINERKKLLPKFAEEETIMIYEHDAFKQASKISRTDKGFHAGEEIIITK